MLETQFHDLQRAECAGLQQIFFLSTKQLSLSVRIHQCVTEEEKHG